MIVNERVDQEDQHQPEKPGSVCEIAMEGDFVDVDGEGQKIAEMDDCPEVVGVLSVGVPVVLKELL